MTWPSAATRTGSCSPSYALSAAGWPGGPRRSPQREAAIGCCVPRAAVRAAELVPSAVSEPDVARGRQTTSPGSEDEAAFRSADWALLLAVAAMWGSSFLFIDIGVDHLAPELVALLRLAFGAATLAVVPAARRRVPRTAWPAIALLGAVWMAVPFVLFAVAQQSIDSSLAGMLNGAAPLFTAIVAGLAARQLPSQRLAAGLVTGLIGVVAISWPSVQDADATAAGAGLVVLATLLYGVAFNLAGPLERRHGALPVIWRAQLVALALVAPFGFAGVPASTFAWSSVLAVAVLGCLGTAIAFVAFTTLVGRVGSTRASVAIYFLPAVAIVLGAGVRDETLAAGSLRGTVLVSAGAYLVSRGERR
jgi:drug/metabolite transporter (DMT)-like permease